LSLNKKNKTGETMTKVWISRSRFKSRGKTRTTYSVKDKGRTGSGSLGPFRTYKAAVRARKRFWGK